MKPGVAYIMTSWSISPRLSQIKLIMGLPLVGLYSKIKTTIIEKLLNLILGHKLINIWLIMNRSST